MCQVGTRRGLPARATATGGGMVVSKGPTRRRCGSVHPGQLAGSTDASNADKLARS